MTEKKEIKPVKQFTIVRRRWRRGKGTREASSVLLNDTDNKMCCLGFYMEACGIPRDKLVNQCFPRSVVRPVDMIGETSDKDVIRILRKAKAFWLVSKSKVGRINNSKLTENLVDVNDDQDKDYADIEKEVKILFAKKGIRVLFR